MAEDEGRDMRGSVLVGFWKTSVGGLFNPSYEPYVAVIQAVLSHQRQRLFTPMRNRCHGPCIMTRSGACPTPVCVANDHPVVLRIFTHVMKVWRSLHDMIRLPVSSP